MKRANNQLELAFALQHLGYSEVDSYHLTNKDELDSDDGFQPGVAVTVRAQGDVVIPNLFASASFLYASGSTDYQGYLQNAETGKLTPFQSSSGARTMEFGAKLGMTLMVSEDVGMTPFLSFVYHDWRRTLGLDTQYQIEEDYQHTEIGGGAMLQVVVSPEFLLTFSGIVAEMAGAAVTIGATNDDPLTLGANVIVRARTEVRWEVGRSVHLMLGYDFGYFTYDASQIGSFAGERVYEPGSRTMLHLMHTGIAYAF